MALRSPPSLSSLTPSTPSAGSVDRKPDRRVSLGVLDSARFRLSHDFARLVRSPSAASSSKSTHTARTSSTHGSRALGHTDQDYENDPDVHVELDPLEMSRVLAELPVEHRSRRAKIYEFLSRSTSRSRSRSKSTTRRSVSDEVPPDLPSLTNTTTTTASTTSDSNYHNTPTRNGSKPLTRSPSRPLSNNTTTTGDTITPTNVRSRTPRATAPPQFDHPAHPVNDSGIGVNEHPYEYDPRMPPPPLPIPLPQPPAQTPTQQKRKSKTPTLFGISLPGRSRPTTPKNEDAPPGNMVSRPMSPSATRGRQPPSSKGGKDKPTGPTWLNPRLFSGPPRPPAEASGQSSRTPIVAPQPRSAMKPSMTAPPTPSTTFDAVPRTHSTPPTMPPLTRSDSSSSVRSGRCSPLLGLGGGARRMFSTKNKGKEKEAGRPVVSVPMMRTRTASREGPGKGGKHGSFDFERTGSSAEVRRSASHGGAAKRPQAQAQAQHAHLRAGTHPQTTPRAHAHVPAHAHSQSTSAVHRNHAVARSPPLQAHSPLLTGASAHSHSTTATSANAGNAGAGGTGSWGRNTRTAGWVRAGVHPPFAFESAASGAGSVTSGGGGRASPSMSEGRVRSKERERERHAADGRRGKESLEIARDRDRQERGGRGVPHVRSREGDKEGRWEQKEVELGLGLAWAPSKIRVREWTGGDRQREREMWEREGARKARERLARYELGYAHGEPRRKTDKEVTGRFRDVLGDAGFETFKKYVRRFDADIIPLDGLLVRVERLLDATSPRGINEREKREMLDDLVRIVKENEW
ncbi:hypothetical protein BV25DRAFT_1821529 [Artomyces pyxidatus]|uniref:Uncharacterized protein n=1 Tax=Artomyces pyxidatus TaxID=48021 RepID=A0ACB8TA96_9AGAM|nr:hypothetical protein BV25DRAFT_1821529 [Artomyces pyxidatus]